MIKLLLSIATIVVILTSNLAHGNSVRTVNSHLSGTDLAKLQKVFEDGLKQNDLQSIYYSVINYNKVNDEKENVCKRLKQLHADSKLNDFEKNFYLIGSHKRLQCTEEISSDILNTLTNSLSKEFATSQEIFFTLFSSKALGIQIDKVIQDRLAKNLQNILKKDDSLSSLGYAFYVAAELSSPSAAFVVDRVEDAIVQADEVDGKMLQFEGGLSITALVVSGAFKLTKAFNKPAPINDEQAVKLATYFLSRRSVQTTKGAHVLIDALKTLSNDKKIAPICIQLIGNGQLQTDSPVLNIKVVDLLGNPVTPSVSTITGKVVVKKGNTVLAEKVIFTSKSSDKTVYGVDLSSYKPTRGIYAIDINADSYQQQLTFKVLGKVKVHSLEIGVGDSDAASALRTQNVIFPSRLSEVLNADHTQKLVLKVILTDEGTTKVISVHQAFVRLANHNTDDEIIFVAEQDSTKAYKFDMDVGAKSADFNHKSGLYKIELIIGDASLSNSFRWHIADVQLKFPQEPKKEQSTTATNRRSPLPEIVHKFREPEKRPPRIVSDIFTGLCLTPLVLLLILWTKLGVNISNFTFSLSTIGFHLGFGAILTLFAIFWLQLNMFETIRYLIPIAIFTFLCGNRLLRSIAARKSSS